MKTFKKKVYKFFKIQNLFILAILFYITAKQQDLRYFYKSK